MEQREINLSFIGSGGWAKRCHFPALAYIQNLKSNAYHLNLRGITSLDPDVTRQVASKYGFEVVYEDIDELLADTLVDAIAVAVSPDAAKSVLTHIMQKRVPVFSEKPPGISTKEALELSEIMTVPNVLAFNRRFIPMNRQFREIVDTMEDITFVEASFYRHDRLDETFMIGTGIHWINFMEYILGSIIQLDTHRWKNPLNDSWLRTGSVTFENGIQGFLKFFPCSGSNYERIVVHSNKQSVYLDGPLWLNPGKIIVDQGSEQEIIKQPTPLPPEVVRIGIVGEYQAFFNLIINQTPSPSTFQNAVNSMRVAEAMEFGQNIISS
jgi:predicted dehydrogenase